MLDNTINKIKNLISESEKKPEYKRGLEDALKIIENNITDLLVVGGWYYIIMNDAPSKDSRDTGAKYIEKMRLYRVTGKSYFFTKDVKMIVKEPDVRFTSERAIKQRVFISEELAKKHMPKGYEYAKR